MRAHPLVLFFLLAFSCWCAGSELSMDQIQPLIEDSCIDCHDSSTETNLNFEELSKSLSDQTAFRMWERIFDRARNGEMPPPDYDQPEKQQLRSALKSIHGQLTEANKKRQRIRGRVPLRRMTRYELERTLHDLLDIKVHLSGVIPAENVSAGFDTVASTQGISSLHAASYLKAAEMAVDSALNFGEQPTPEPRKFVYPKLDHIRKYLTKEPEGRILVKETKDAVVMFVDANWIFRIHNFRAKAAGMYRIRAEAYPHQSDRPVILRINIGNFQLGTTRLGKAFDLVPGDNRIVEFETYLDRDDYIYPSPDDIQNQDDGKSIWQVEAPEYTGSGVAIKWIEITGPLHKKWPPPSVDRLLPGIEVKKRENPRWVDGQPIHYDLVKKDNPAQQLEQIVAHLAPRAFRRPLRKGEGEQYVEFGIAALESGRSFEEAARVTCHAILTSPHFLFIVSGPGKLNDFELASRLSYFLWKTLPDEELFEVAQSGKLTKPAVLREQVDRMLDDPKARVFVDDFTDQWLKLKDIDATTPDERLYPEFDELLEHAMLEETRSFFHHLIAEDLSSDNLIDSDFTMLNRRLAEHYEIPGVNGQSFRVVELPEDSIRGGLLTQAAVLKVTANGTVSSPVLRGSWVLKHLLGTPPSQPPPGIGAIEPDTRGATTVRELLAAHRNVESCNACHKRIDPPGFALECFDVIGGYRDRYRSKEGDRPQKKFRGRGIWEYRLGPAVDSSGQLASGREFKDFVEFRELLKTQRDKVAKHLIEQLVVYSTGAEIQFADREQIKQLTKQARAHNYGVRSMIHDITQSRLFTYR